MIRNALVPSHQKLDQLLSKYKLEYHSKPEIDRIKGAIKLIQASPKKFSQLIPSVVSRQDYWYLIQLFSQGHHVHKNLSPYTFNLSASPSIYLETSKSLQKLLRLPPLPHSRKLLDKHISAHQTKALTSLNLNPTKWRVSPIPYDILIRLKSDQIKNGSFNYHLDGYRLRPDGILTGLIGGHVLFGGHQFVDSIWTNITSSTTKTKLVIIPKEHGHK